MDRQASEARFSLPVFVSQVYMMGGRMGIGIRRVYGWVGVLASYLRLVATGWLRIRDSSRDSIRDNIRDKLRSRCPYTHACTHTLTLPTLMSHRLDQKDCKINDLPLYQIPTTNKSPYPNARHSYTHMKKNAMHPAFYKIPSSKRTGKKTNCPIRPHVHH